MKKGKLLNLIAAGCMFLALAGSAKTILADPTTPAGWVEQGKTNLFINEDLLTANDDFQQAWNLDGNYPQANFWYGLTRVLVLIQSNDTVNLLNNFGFTKESDGTSLRPGCS